jgi:hypothetical protein
MVAREVLISLYHGDDDLYFSYPKGLHALPLLLLGLHKKEFIVKSGIYCALRKLHKIVDIPSLLCAA